MPNTSRKVDFKKNPNVREIGKNSGKTVPVFEAPNLSKKAEKGILTRKQRSNTKAEPGIKVNAKSEVAASAAAAIANAVATTNTIAEARKKLEASNLLGPTKKAALDTFDKEYIEELKSQSRGEINRPRGEINRNLGLDEAVNEQLEQLLEHMETLEEAEETVKADDEISADVKKRLLEVLKRDFNKLKGIEEEVPAAAATPATPAAAPLLPAVGDKAKPKPKIRRVGEQRAESVLKAREATPAAPAEPAKQPEKRARTPEQLAANKARSNAAAETLAKRRAEVKSGRAAKAAAEAAAKAAGANTPPSPEPVSPPVSPPSPEAVAPATAPEPEVNNATLINATKPTLMRIGGDQTSEYVELKGGQFKSLGGFEVVTMSLGTKEFKQHYGIKTPEQFSVMQRVFGVPRLGGKPKLWTYLEQNCKFDGVDVVKRALETRSKSLQIAIQMNVDSNVSKRYKHLKQWIDETAQKIGKAVDPCPPEKVNVATGMNKKNVGVGPNAPATTVSASGPACPCLTDINLLRDLVYVVALARGNASPEVRKQISKIPINSLLEAAAGNNSAKMYPNMKQTLIQILKILRTASTAVKNGDIAEIPQDVLMKIFLALKTPEMETPPKVELDDILSLINDMQNALTGYQKDLEEARSKLPEGEDPELVALRGIRHTLEEKLVGAEATIQAIQDIVNDVSAQLDDCNDSKAEQEAHIHALEEEIQRLIHEKESERELQDADHQEILDAKEAELEKYKEAYQQLLAHIQGLNEEHTRLKQKADEADELRAQLAACTAEKEGLQEQLRAAEIKVGELEGELAELARSSMSNKNKGDKATKKLQEELEAAKAEVSRLKAEETEKASQLAGLAEQVRTQNTELDQLRARIAELSGEKERANREKGRANAAEAAGVAKNTEISSLREKLQLAQATLSEREAAMALSSAELSVAKAALEQQKQQGNSNAESAKADFEQQLAQEKAKLAECNSAAETARQAHEKELAELREQLAEAQSTLDKLKALVDDTEGKKVATQGQLDSALAKVEELKKEIASKTTTGAEQQASFEGERDGFKQRIAELEAELESERQRSAGSESELQQKIQDLGGRIRTLEDEHAAELQRLKEQQRSNKAASNAQQRAKNEEAAAASKAELESKQTEIDQLREQLAAAQAQAGLLADKNAAISSKNALITQQTGQLQQKNTQIATLEAKQGELSAEIAALQGKLGSLQGETNTTKTQRAANAAEIESLKAKLANAERQKRNNDGTIASLRGNLNRAPKQENVDALTRNLSTAESEIKSLTAKLADVEAAKGSIEQTSTAALNNLLAELAVSEEQRAALEKAAKGDMSGLIDIKKETCDFFFFLYDTINLQLRNIKKLKLSETLKKDIFQMYNLPESYSAMNKQDLLNEISAAFQEFFIKFDTRTGCPSKGLALDMSYPLLTELFKNITVVEEKGICKLTPKEQVQIRDELNRIGYQYDYAIEPISDSANKLVIFCKSDPDICIDKSHKHDHLVPLTVLALRMIQLLHETFEGRYKELKMRCLPAEIASADMPDVEEEA